MYFMTMTELAQALRIQPSTLRKYYYTGVDLPKRTRLGKKQIIMQHDYEAWLKKKQRDKKKKEDEEEDEER